MKMQDYLDRPEASASGFSMLMDNARKFRLVKDGKLNLRSKEKDYGTVAHALILEPEIASQLFVIDDNIKESIIEMASMDPNDLVVIDVHNKNCKEFQTAKKDFPHKKIITSEEFDHLCAYLKIKDKIILSTNEFEQIVKPMVGKIMELENFQLYLKEGIKEQSFFGVIDDLPVKCRPDLMFVVDQQRTDAGLIPVFIFDVKSMFSEISGHGFSKASAEHHYYMSEALCRNILMQNGYEVVGYNFVGMSKVDWSGAEYFQHEHSSLMQGERLLRNAVKKFKYCTKHNLWLEKEFDFYKEQFCKYTTIVIPAYAFHKYNLPEEM